MTNRVWKRLRLPNDPLRVVVISRDGKTPAVCHADEQALNRTDATVVAFAKQPLAIDHQPGDNDQYWHIPLPDVMVRDFKAATEDIHLLLQISKLIYHCIVYRRWCRV